MINSTIYPNLIRFRLLVRLFSGVKNPGTEPAGMIPLHACVDTLWNRIRISYLTIGISEISPINSIFISEAILYLFMFSNTSVISFVFSRTIFLIPSPIIITSQQALPTFFAVVIVYKIDRSIVIALGKGKD